MEKALQLIIRKTGRKPVSCKCDKCRNQCRTPCLGTPDDILRLIEAGYRSRLVPTLWGVGLVMGRLPYAVPMVQAIREDNGFCTFYHNGLCELHDLGLKPTEGRLSHHHDGELQVRQVPLVECGQGMAGRNKPTNYRQDNLSDGKITSAEPGGRP